jgi:uncharacterized integral membrane protein
VICAAQWLLLGGWAVVVPMFIGWGVVTRWLWREPLRADAADLLLSFWIGWAAVLVALQLWHFALPVNESARIAIAAGGAIGLGGVLRPSWRLARRLYRAVPLLAAGALAAIWLSNRAMEPRLIGDTGGYYVPTIRWMTEHRLIVGLANLYAPLAYNQTYFLYAALLDVGPFAGQAHHLLNSTLIAVLAARTLLGLWRVLRPRGTPWAADLFYALMLPAEVEAAVEWYLFTSPAPDFGVYALGIALCGELVAVLAGPSRDLRLHFLALALLCAVAPTVKLPLFGLAAAAMVIGTVVWIRRAGPTWRTTLGSLALAAGVGALTIGPWIAGNVLLSGCPFFPSAIGALPVAWRVDWDVQQAIQEFMILGDWHLLLRDPHWVEQRFIALGWTAPGVVVPLGIALVAIVLSGLAAVARAFRTRRDGVRLAAAALLAPLASLAFCIKTTPMPRYAGATMWLLAGLSVLVMLHGRLLGPLARRAAALGAVALVALPFATGAPRWLHYCYRDFPRLPRAVVEPQQLASGLQIYVPHADNPSCWDAPLPCTPYPHLGLRLRHPPDVDSGFEVAPGSAPPPRQ